MADGQPRYRSYLLRVWQPGDSDPPEWRMSLENVMTHERLGFIDLADLVTFLKKQMGYNNSAKMGSSARDQGMPES